MYQKWFLPLWIQLLLALLRRKERFFPITGTSSFIEIQHLKTDIYKGLYDIIVENIGSGVRFEFEPQTQHLPVLWS